MNIILFLNLLVSIFVLFNCSIKADKSTRSSADTSQDSTDKSTSSSTDTSTTEQTNIENKDGFNLQGLPDFCLGSLTEENKFCLTCTPPKLLPNIRCIPIDIDFDPQKACQFLQESAEVTCESSDENKFVMALSKSFVDEIYASYLTIRKRLEIVLMSQIAEEDDRLIFLEMIIYPFKNLNEISLGKDNVTAVNEMLQILTARYPFADEATEENTKQKMLAALVKVQDDLYSGKLNDKTSLAMECSDVFLAAIPEGHVLLKKYSLQTLGQMKQLLVLYMFADDT